MAFHGDSIFWVEVDKISPNPYQPRKDFDEARLADLADSIRQYGVLQPLVVTRKEYAKDDGGLAVEYELIAGERRLRASRLANLQQVPVIIRDGEESDRMKLELAIIENLQREDLNPIDRARAFSQLVNEFGFKHSEVAQKIGKSREYVSNSLRLLTMPEEMQQALAQGKISEGHTRPILMLNDRQEEQMTLYKEIIYKKLTVRESESIARRIAHDKIRKRRDEYSPELLELERTFTEWLGTRVQIEKREQGGKLVIDYFSDDDLRSLLLRLPGEEEQMPAAPMSEMAAVDDSGGTKSESGGESASPESSDEQAIRNSSGTETKEDVAGAATPETEQKETEEEIYSVKNFTI